MLKALKVFETLKNDIPLVEMETSKVDKFYKSFESANLEMKYLMLDVTVCAVKCIYIDAMIILQQSPEG